MADPLASVSSSSLTILPPNLTLLISNLSSFVTVKLNAPIFLIWRNQIQNILRATGLLGYVDGTIPCPLAKIKDSSGSKFQHCYEIWNALIKRFIILSTSHIHQLKNKLNTVSKKGASMEEYLTQIKELSNQLALASAIVEDEDLVLITLNGLLDEYDSFKTAIHARSEGISMDELCALLCSESIHVELKTHKLSPIEQPNVVFSAAQGSRSNQIGSSGYFRGSQGLYFSKGGRGGRFSQQSCGRFFSRGRGCNGPICPICGVFGHIAFDY
ncbi:uncharacterized protein LOC114279781 [Camellia sinensis]|uniref:uncharacterized protein LOC114279781 n=1 Tax=Camellia sinensis TaxID=4442 RepID=UPI0010360B0F|nr:uncharacterized protein LOC114279781 [Camellia sinensis]